MFKITFGTLLRLSEKYPNLSVKYIHYAEKGNFCKIKAKNTGREWRDIGGTITLERLSRACKKYDYVKMVLHTDINEYMAAREKSSVYNDWKDTSSDLLYMGRKSHFSEPFAVPYYNYDVADYNDHTSGNAKVIQGNNTITSIIGLCVDVRNLEPRMSKRFEFYNELELNPNLKDESIILLSSDSHSHLMIYFKNDPVNMSKTLNKIKLVTGVSLEGTIELNPEWYKHTNFIGLTKALCQVDKSFEDNVIDLGSLF